MNQFKRYFICIELNAKVPNNYNKNYSLLFWENIKTCFRFQTEQPNTRDASTKCRKRKWVYGEQKLYSYLNNETSPNCIFINQLIRIKVNDSIIFGIHENGNLLNNGFEFYQGAKLLCKFELIQCRTGISWWFIQKISLAGRLQWKVVLFRQYKITMSKSRNEQFWEFPPNLLNMQILKDNDANFSWI